MNLKFQSVAWDGNLMYVEFLADGQNVRWYPKWKDLANLFTQAWLTETDLSNGRLREYLAFCSLKIAMDYVLIHSGRQFPIFAEAMQDIEHQLLEGDSNATTEDVRPRYMERP